MGADIFMEETRVQILIYLRVTRTLVGEQSTTAKEYNALWVILTVFALTSYLFILNEYLFSLL